MQCCFRDHFLRPAEAIEVWRDPAGALFTLAASGRMPRLRRALHNPHIAITDFPRPRDGGASVRALLAALAPLTDCLEAAAVPPGGRLAAELRAAAGELGATITTRPREGNSRLPLAATWEQTRAALSKNLVQGTERKRRQLEKLGALTFALHDDPARLSAPLQDALRLEQASWKGTLGTAILDAPATRGFYTDLAHRAAAAGAFALYEARLDGALIAFELCLRHGGELHLLKLSYDPTYAPQSPGNALRLWLLQQEQERFGTRLYDFGIASEWKRRWSEVVLPIEHWRMYFPHPRGRLAYWFGPGARGALKRLGPVRTAISALRDWRARRRRAAKAAAKGQAE